MYSVSETYAKKIISDDRAFAVRLTFGSSRVITGTTIQNMALDEIVNSTDVLTMGCACSNKITINLINPPTDIDYSNTDFTAEAGLLVEDRPITYEWIPLGKFYGAEAETNNDFKNLTLTAYDGFIKMSGKYNTRVAGATTLQAVYDDLKTQLRENCGIILKERMLPEYAIEDFPNLDITYTQAAGYVAGCLGEFARFDRNGELEFTWYTNNGQTIDRTQQYMGGFKRTTDKVLTVTSISTGTQDKPIIRGGGVNGTGINFENPYITDAMADDIYNKINNFTYTPCQVLWRGDPAVQAGDMVQALDENLTAHTILVMSQSLKIGGGCNASIDCKGKTETTSQFSNGFESTRKKIEKAYRGLEKAILDATNKITGNTGGYVVIHDTNDDGKPDEILITNAEDIAFATKVWRWNKEGLGYSHNPAGNAYAGPYGVAITADGQINADFIATGTLRLGGYNNSSGRFELYNEAGGLIAEMDNTGLTFTANSSGDYVKLSAEKGLVGYDKNGNEIYLADAGVFKMKNAEVENEIKIAGKIKIVPVSTESNVGVGFVALV
jgi:hypothetical protein